MPVLVPQLSIPDPDLIEILFCLFLFLFDQKLDWNDSEKEREEGNSIRAAEKKGQWERGTNMKEFPRVSSL